MLCFALSPVTQHSFYQPFSLGFPLLYRLPLSFPFALSFGIISKNYMKKTLLGIKVISLAVLPYLLHAKFSLVGGSPHVELPPLTDLSPLLGDVPALAGTLLTWYELLVRLVPTARNRSLVAALGKLLEALVPNRLTDGPAS